LSTDPTWPEVAASFYRVEIGNSIIVGGQIMTNWILVIGYNRSHFEAAQRDWLKFNVLLQSVDTVQEAIEKFSTRSYLGVVAAYEVADLTLLIEVMREAKQIPLLVLSQEESGTKMAESIIKGADTFIIDVDNLIDSIKNNEEIIDRLTQLSPHNKQTLGILTHREIFMLVEYRKVFVRDSEIRLARSNFDILQLLLSQAGRVFTYEQLYFIAYGEDIETDITTNAVRCHISRIRQQLRIKPTHKNYIDSVRSVGYRIAI
jgi:DNA-binding response OmpR family regulator